MQQITIPFGPWAPDLPPFVDLQTQTPHCITVTNVLPHVNGYKAFAGPQEIGSAASASVYGGVSVIDDEGDVSTYIGTADNLYIWDSANLEWDEVSKSSDAYGLTTDESWSFVQWGAKIIATNLTDPVQISTVGAGNTFADMITSTLTPKAKYVTVAREFVFLGNTHDATDGYKPSRIWWSAVNDETDFDPSVTTQCDYQDLPSEAGEVTAIIGGRDYITIFQQRAITRGDYVGSPVIWKFDTVENGRGLIAPGAYVSLGRFVFFLSDEGFMMFDGTSATPIGVNTVDKFFKDRVHNLYRIRTRAAIDSRNKLVFFAYAGPQSAGELNEMLIYSYEYQRWSMYTGTSFTTLFSGLTHGYTLEELDNFGNLDTLPFPLDSSVWQGGRITIAGMTTNNKLAYFDGTTLEGEITTAEFQLAPGKRSTVHKLRPLCNGGNPSSINVLHRKAQADSTTSSAFSSVTSDGASFGRVSNRYHRINIDNTGTTFTDLQGVEVSFRPEGMR